MFLVLVGCRDVVFYVKTCMMLRFVSNNFEGRFNLVIL